MRNKLKYLKEALGFAVPRAIPQMLLLSIILLFIQLNIIGIIITFIIVILIIYRYTSMYLSVRKSIDEMDEIARRDDADSVIKSLINRLECSEKIVSKSHDLYRSISPVSILSIIFTVLAKVSPDYSNQSINNVGLKIWQAIGNLEITLNNFGNAILSILLLLLLWCLFKTIDTLYKYNNIVASISRYKDELITLNENQ